jgi:hypothetical protein
MSVAAMRYASAVEFPRPLFHEASEGQKFPKSSRIPKKTPQGVIK